MNDAIEDLPLDDCRYLISDYVVHTNDGRVVSRTLLINWVPQNTKLKLRTVFATNKKAMMNALPNIQVDIIADNKEEIRDEAIKEKVKRAI